MLADHVFEPAMLSGKMLPYVFGSLVGTGKGSGMAVMFLFTGILGAGACLLSLFLRDLRNLETDIQDHNFRVMMK